jgi:hypothetical protein
MLHLIVRFDIIIYVCILIECVSIYCYSVLRLLLVLLQLLLLHLEPRSLLVHKPQVRGPQEEVEESQNLKKKVKPLS